MVSSHQPRANLSRLPARPEPESLVQFETDSLTAAFEFQGS